MVLASPGCQNQPDSQTNSSPSENTHSVTIALLGDVMLGRAVHATSDTFAYLKPYLTSADLVLTNLESPLTTFPVQTESSYALCAPPENVKYLVDASIDLLALSNNHHLDCGIEGLLETQSILTNAGLGFIGPKPDPISRSINGIQLAFLAFDATARFDVETAAQAVKVAHETGAMVVVSVHWGAEYQSGASPAQKKIAEALSDAGARLIWGHHPHVLQPAEWIQDRKTLVFYSLGNALFDQYGLENTRQSALLLVTIESHGVKDFKVIPFLIDVRDSRIVAPTPADAQVIRQYFK